MERCKNLERGLFVSIPDVVNMAQEFSVRIKTAVGIQWEGKSERNSNARLMSTKLQFNSFALSRQSVQISLNFRMSPFVDT